MNCPILVTCPAMLATLDRYAERFQQEGLMVTAPAIVQQLSEAELCDLVGNFAGIIAGDDPFTAKVLEVGQRGRLRVLTRWGVGMDNVDRTAAATLGIRVSNTPDVFGDEVADVAVGYLVLLARQLHKIDAAVRRGEWLKVRGTSLRGKVAGIIGVGSIGSAIARRFHAMGLTLLGYDIRPIATTLCQETQIQQVELAELLSRADCVVLSCSLTPETYRLLDDASIARMRGGAWVINVSRGNLIDEAALLRGLHAGKIAAAALDVFATEPPPADHPLLQCDRVIAGSHNGSNTQEAVLRVSHLAIDALVRDLRLAQILDPVTA